MNPEFKSKEETAFSWWLDELVNLGYAISWRYEPCQFILSPAVKVWQTEYLKTKTRQKERSLLKEHAYTPDFLVEWNSRQYGSDMQDKQFWQVLWKETFELMPTYFVAHVFRNGLDLPTEKKLVIPGRDRIYSLFEVKGGFDRFNSARMFVSDQKMLFYTQGIFVNKVHVAPKKGVFQDTFTPERYLLTDTTKQPRKLGYDPVMAKDFFKPINN